VSYAEKVAGHVEKSHRLRVRRWKREIHLGGAHFDVTCSKRDTCGRLLQNTVILLSDNPISSGRCWKGAGHDVGELNLDRTNFREIAGMPTFVDQRIHELLQVASAVEHAVQPQENRQPSARQVRFHGLLAGLNTLPSVARIRYTLNALQEEEGFTEDLEERADVEAIQYRILIGLYGNVMQMLLEEAIEADDAARWWWRVEKSKTNTAWFMVQSEFCLLVPPAKLTRYVFLAFPQRVYTLTSVIITSLRMRNIPISLSLFSPSAFRQLFPQSSRPSELVTSIFPHLSGRSHVLARSPLHLTHDECKDKRKQLEQLRNERATTLGRFAVASQVLEADLTSGKVNLSRALQEFETLGASTSLLGGSLQSLSSALESIDLFHMSHTTAVAPLQRPSRLVLLWPKLLLIPPITYVVLGWAWSSREDFKRNLREGMDTARVFYQSWLVEPIRSILATVRTRGDEGVRVISKEALKADMDVSAVELIIQSGSLTNWS
jgi:nuclear-control-of-ATPase protein 2